MNYALSADKLYLIVTPAAGETGQPAIIPVANVPKTIQALENNLAVWNNYAAEIAKLNPPAKS